ncbi:MAG: hypothetical protein JW902_06200 [Syntrophaceae bacterium]|nr:hypothetical protein [Syntrophaceae bacterium]
MAQNASNLLLIIGALALFFALLVMLSRRWKWKASRWQDLAKLFPAPERSPGITIYYRCAGQAGNVHFTPRDLPQLGVGFSPKGITIRIKSKNYPDLLVLWGKIRSAIKYSLGARTVAKVEVECKIPLHFILSDEILSAFETWHKVEAKSPHDLLRAR